MIRINLLPQPRPKARRGPSLPAGAMFQTVVLLIGLVVGLLVLGGIYVLEGNELKEKQKKVADLTAEKARLERIKLEVEGFMRQKEALDRRIAVIQDLQRNKVGGQELLDAVANTVVRTDTLWLTLMERKGNTLTFEGTAASLTAVANFITQLKRSGYFDKVEIKESRQDEQNKAVQTFLFTLTADFVLPGTQQPGAGTAPAAGKT
jgi:Tfp pilus assembly protein PilN